MDIRKSCGSVVDITLFFCFKNKNTNYLKCYMLYRYNNIVFLLSTGKEFKINQKWILKRLENLGRLPSTTLQTTWTTSETGKKKYSFRRRNRRNITICYITCLIIYFKNQNRLINLSLKKKGGT